MVASDDGPVDHVPPVAASNNAADEPTHTIGAPVIAGGGGNTVINLVAVQPAPNEYVIVAKPGDTPHTWPVAFTVATPVLLLLQLPPVVASVSTVHDPTHTLPDPEIPAGGAFTVNIALTEQPVPGV
jgi:hypothetical protein